VQTLIATGAKVDEKSADGLTALHYACEEGHVEIVPRLIAAGVKVNEKSANCRTTLHVACYLGRLEIGKIVFPF
jgi:ankyrin repeat protein